MPALDVPETGLSLCRDNPAGKPPQIMRLNLAQNTLDDLIQTLRNDKPARVRLGKHPALYYGSKSQSFHSFAETLPSEIYRGSSADKENLYFTGVLSHSLEVEKAREATAATDQALANLEQSLNAFERGKESRKTHLIEDVRALRAGDGRSASGRQAALLAGRSSNKSELEKDRLLKNGASNRSLTSSPALGVSRSPTSIPPLTPTSAPLPQNKDRIRLDALKTPFVHLLAVRAVSTKFLARQTRASPEDCEALAQQYGVKNRINPEKFDLKDRTYKELDVWKFPYPSQEDRQEAIENAISAFDRLRISRTDKLWQTLLPKEERGKGKCLSRLNLQTGPKKKPETPRIQVQSADDAGKEGYTTGADTDRTGASGPTAKRSAEPTSAPKPTAATQKKKVAEKDAAKKPATKSKTAGNSTLTGRITKKAEKKPVIKPDGKFKSAEYVNDSDDDDTDIPDAPPVEKPKLEKAKPKAKAPSKPIDTTPRDSSHAPTPKVEAPEVPPSKSESSQISNKSVSSKRLPSSRGPGQKSPQKPSPLGSSPPTNASELQNRSRSSSQNNTSSSSSSSPLITQVAKTKQATKTLPAPAKLVKTNGVVKSTPTPVANPLKRKAELERPAVTRPLAAGRTTGDLEHKRRRAVSTSSGSTGSASPPLSREILFQQLRDKSQLFKQNYAKYRTLHDSMASHPDPPRADVERLQRQHAKLQRMKKEIWDEDRRLRDRLS
ncbi:hypothetical protein P170DRAFT_470386 [Aspergillus steynii IBT 23096]|uniref:Uncharacterized protein n=1 Tax=Aspergillus steynii IBT 23096 TaxID=1392250 RepID=A0A2I2GQ06_9EURO|nr:uncharacterized protein P170DRAFT_470386 [Aspergillus steynii IBT 23096]PLB54957.1 hypothetical protein P170DRAFT_470386 [Aspergillus steynii IBT 23096]